MNHIPQDHKNLIYQFLSIKDLLHLGQTCKAIHHDEKRIQIIQKKIIDSCFYAQSIKPVLKESLIQIYPNVMNDYFHRLKTIQITDTSNYQISYPIPFFISPFLMLPVNVRSLIVKNLTRYLYDLWMYAQDNQITPYSSISLFDSLENILKEIFIYDIQSIKVYILYELYEFSNKTKSSDRRYSKNRHSYFNTEPNRYTVDRFICSLGLRYWKDLECIIEIADLLESYDLMYLYDFLYEIFQPFIDWNYFRSEEHDEYIYEFEDKLNESYDTHMTYKDRLFELFTSSEYMIHDEFKYVFEARRRRLDGLEDIDEDYDY